MPVWKDFSVGPKKEQADADKDTGEESEVAVAAADMKPGERKVISDGTEGPVVEIIRRSTTDEPEAPVAAEETDSSADEQNADTDTKAKAEAEAEAEAEVEESKE